MSTWGPFDPCFDRKNNFVGGWRSKTEVTQALGSRYIRLHVTHVLLLFWPSCVMLQGTCPKATRDEKHISRSRRIVVDAGIGHGGDTILAGGTDESKPCYDRAFGGIEIHDSGGVW